MRVVTIDGPAGAGKSTVARLLAAHLDWRLLDTGAMYRAITLAALRAGVDLESDLELGALAESVRLELPPGGGVVLNGEDVSGLIRSVDVTRASRHLADSPRVRGVLVERQRECASATDTVTEGRDQGTVVFPDAFRKFYMIATDDERARRRFAEFRARGELVALDEVAADIKRRDAHDAARSIAPMRPADDAVIVDTTGVPLADVVANLARLVLDCASLEREERP